VLFLAERASARKILVPQFLLTNLVNNAVQTPIDSPEVSPAKAA